MRSSPNVPPELSKEPQVFTIKGRVEGKRLDAYLTSRFQDYSRSVIQKVIDAEAALVNGRPGKASTKVREGDTLTVWLPELVESVPVAEDIPLPIIYEDEWLVVIDKPAGLVTHPAKGNWTGTVVNALQFHFDKLSNVGGPLRPGIVHRLDRETSGLLIVMKDDMAHSKVGQQFESRTIRKEYLAIVSGVPARDSDYIEKPIGPHPTHREKMAIRLIADGAKEAVTFYEVVERFPHHALVRCHPKTGRTHQIRVHLTHIGLPLLADKLYSGRGQVTRGDLLGAKAEGADEVVLDRQALHAHRLSFEHPVTHAPLDLTSPLPADMGRILETLRGQGGR